MRYRIVPDAGIETYDSEEVKRMGENFLRQEIVKRVKEGKVRFRLKAQVAEESDQTDDATVHWPEIRNVVDLGAVTLDEVVDLEAQKGEQKKIIFDPIPRVQGIEPSADPLLDMRAGIYIISGKQRRAAE